MSKECLFSLEVGAISKSLFRSHPKHFQHMTGDFFSQEFIPCFGKVHIAGILHRLLDRQHCAVEVVNRDFVFLHDRGCDSVQPIQRPRVELDGIYREEAA